MGKLAFIRLESDCFLKVCSPGAYLTDPRPGLLVNIHWCKGMEQSHLAKVLEIFFLWSKYHTHSKSLLNQCYPLDHGPVDNMFKIRKRNEVRRLREGEKTENVSKNFPSKCFFLGSNQIITKKSERSQSQVNQELTAKPSILKTLRKCLLSLRRIIQTATSEECSWCVRLQPQALSLPITHNTVYRW